MKQLIKKILPECMINFLRIILCRKYKRSYSQSGEDMIINNILCGVKKGFYVDIGANNPWIQSNTMFFYEKGWTGINVDATPGSMKVFRKLRKRDINLEFAISDVEEKLKLFMYQSPFFNRLKENKAESNTNKLINVKELKTVTLEWVFDKYAQGKNIDFLSVDTEGFDFNVLKSNNWEKYRPKIVIIEVHAPVYYCHFKETEMGQFLEKKSYTFYCNTNCNLFFLENTFMKERCSQVASLNK